MRVKVLKRFNLALGDAGYPAMPTTDFLRQERWVRFEPGVQTITGTYRRALWRNPTQQELFVGDVQIYNGSVFMGWSDPIPLVEHDWVKQHIGPPLTNEEAREELAKLRAQADEVERELAETEAAMDPALKTWLSPELVEGVEAVMESTAPPEPMQLGVQVRQSPPPSVLSGPNVRTGTHGKNFPPFGAGS